MSSIKPIIRHIGRQHIIYDGSTAESIVPQWLDVEYWQTRAQVETIGLGRGSAWFITAENNDFVLRHYQRGGLIARFLDDQYFWSGLERSRAFCEWRLLAHLQQLQLPVPSPIAARVTRLGLFYTADLLTQRLKDTCSLSHAIQSSPLSTMTWQQIGKTIATFHQNQIYHADLNAHNILLSDTDNIYLIDFDRGSIKSGQNWKQKNLERLQRSLSKLTQQQQVNFTNQNWDELMKGYQG